MKIVYCSGGLANQMVNYVFARYMEITTGEPHYIEDSHFFCRTSHNGFELDKVFPNIKLRYFKEQFDPKLYSQNLYNLSQVQNYQLRTTAFKNLGLEKVLIVRQRAKWLNALPGVTLDSSEFVKCKGNPQNIAYYDNISYVGSITSDRMFKEIAEQMQHEFKFKEIQDETNKKYLHEINEQSSVSIAVHMRRGDFVTLSQHKMPNEYVEPLKFIREKTKNTDKKTRFFIFSDDIKWCKDNVKELGFIDTDNLLFIEGNNVEAKNYIDMQLISNCDIVLAPGISGFARYGSLLNKNLIAYIGI